MKAGSAAIQAIAAADTRTRAAGSSRIELVVEHTFEMSRRRWWAGLMRPMASVAKAAGKRLLKAVTGNVDLRRQSAEGVIDLRASRWMLDYGSYARLYAEGMEWDGRSGRPLATLPPNQQELPSPLWLLDILAELDGATEEGAEDVRGTACRRFSATVDMSRASQPTAGGVATSKLGRFGDMLAAQARAQDRSDQAAVPIEVWLDDEHVRRVRFLPEHRVETLELWDFGVSPDDLDWTRLPTFRSSEEAAALTKDKGRN